FEQAWRQELAVREARSAEGVQGLAADDCVGKRLAQLVAIERALLERVDLGDRVLLARQAGLRDFLREGASGIAEEARERREFQLRRGRQSGRQLRRRRRGRGRIESLVESPAERGAVRVVGEEAVAGEVRAAAGLPFLLVAELFERVRT